MLKLKILLSGATGKVGREIARLVRAGEGEEIVGRAGSDAFFSDDAPADVLIDFSRPELTVRCLEYAVQRGTPIVIGTTALDDAAQQAIEQAARRIPVCQAANFSIGVNLLLDLVARAAAGLPESFDVEIAEIHHRWKVDAPSGTALALGRAVRQARGNCESTIHDVAIRGDGQRRAGEIGYQVARGGDGAGEHTVLFLGDGERIELGHRATDREIFARGALLAARWLIGQPPGRYSMQDVLAAGSN